MRYFLLLLGILLSASAAHAQDAPQILIGYVEYETRSIGGVKVELKNLKFTEIKALGAWIFEDEAGRHGYIFIDGAQEAKYANSDLVVPLGERVFEVTRLQKWKTGETALILDDLDEDSAALLRQGNFRAPLEEQLDVKWQPLGDAKVRLTVTNRGAQTLLLALHNAQYIVAATRDKKPINASIVPTGIDEAPKFEPIKAGAKWQRDLVLNPNSEISQAGHYEVEFETQFPLQNGGTAKDPEYIVLKFAGKFEFDVPENK